MHRAWLTIVVLSCGLPAARADVARLADSGAWSAFADLVGPRKMCAVQSTVDGASFALFGRTEKPRTLQIALHRPSWRIAHSAVPVTLAFGDGGSFVVPGTADAAFVRADIPPARVGDLIRRITAGGRVSVTLPAAIAPPWEVDLTGAGPALDAMSACLEVAALWLPPPFRQPPQAQLPPAQFPQAGAPADVAPVPKAVAASPPPPPSPETPAPPPVPVDLSAQDRFVAVVKAAAAEFDDAPNDLLKGAARVHRRKELCQLPNGLTATDWTGTIAGLSSSGAGLGVLEVQVAEAITVATSNNAFSDLGVHTLIQPDEPFFAALSAMRVGARIVFSGSFLADADDCYSERSLTQSGSMTAPEFTFKFTDVRAAP